MLAVFFIRTAAFSSGILLSAPDDRKPAQYPVLVSEHIDVAAEASSAVTTVEQVFLGPSSFVPSVSCVFPVPKGSTVSGFTVAIDDDAVNAEHLDASEARALCMEKVRSSKDASFLAFSASDLFRFTLPSFSPNERKRVVISFTSTLSFQDAPDEYVFPLNTHGLNPGNRHDVKISVRVKKDHSPLSLRSLTHPVSVSDEGETLCAVYSGSNIVPDSDFRLMINRTDAASDCIFKTYREEGADGYFFFECRPPVNCAAMERDVTFLLDVSGSMAGKKIDAALKAISSCIDKLTDADRFQVISFGSSASALFGSISRADAAHRLAARSFLGRVSASGGTNLDEALKLAFESNKDSLRLSQIVLITDGMPSAGETSEDILAEQVRKASKSNTRFYCVGFDYDFSSRLLERFSGAAGGRTVCLDSAGDIGRGLDVFLESIRFPLLSGITVTVKGMKTSGCAPASVPDLFAGGSVAFCGRYAGEGTATLVVQASASGKSRTFVYPLSFPSVSATHFYIAPIWASRRAGELLSRMRLRGESFETSSELVSLSRSTGMFPLSSRYYTAEDEARRESRGELAAGDMTIGAVGSSSSQMTVYKNEIRVLKSPGGADGVRAVSMIGAASAADNADDAYRAMGETSSPAVQNPAEIRRNNGAVFFHAKKGWIDPRVQTAPGYPVRKILFASDEYFDLLNQEPGIERILSSGNRIRFVYRNRIFEISEP
jgi:Ca-activated chloride channel family protein